MWMTKDLTRFFDNSPGADPSLARRKSPEAINATTAASEDAKERPKKRSHSHEGPLRRKACKKAGSGRIDGVAMRR